MEIPEGVEKYDAGDGDAFWPDMDAPLTHNLVGVHVQKNTARKWQCNASWYDCPKWLGPEFDTLEEIVTWYRMLLAAGVKEI